MRHPSLLSLLGFAFLTSTFGCKHTDTAADPGDTNIATSPLLKRAQSCEDLSAALKSDARARLAKAVREQWRDGSDFPPPMVLPGVGGATSGPSGDWGTGTGGLMATGGSSAGIPGSDEGVDPEPMLPGSYTKTNTQVAGVDEADIVKTDGVNIYVLRSSMPDLDGVATPEVVVAKAWPVEDAALSARIAVEGSPREMFVVGEPGASESRIVVYSTIDGPALYAEAGLPPPAVQDSGYMGDPVDCWGCYAPLTKLTVLAFRDGALAVDRELYYEGSYVSSRRADNLVRTTLQLASRAPALRTYATSADEQKAELMVLEDLVESGQSVADVRSEDLAEMLADRLGDVLVLENEAAIEEMSHEDWLPRVFTRSSTGIEVKTLGCTDFYIPPAGSGQGGVTSVALLDLNALSGDARGAAIVGAADTLYQNATSLVLAAQEWSFVPEPGGSLEQTVVHAFDVSDPAAIVHRASGEIPGRVYGQFAIDEQAGVFRLATTETDATGTTSNRVTLLQANEKTLEISGALTGLAPGETVSAVRWVGDRGYVVTRVQARDPLFVVDVSDPTAPTLLGELPIKGFSEYLHPLDGEHLLTIGRDGDESGMITGNVALRIYDVANPAAPIEEHMLPFEESGDSLAEANHKAFTYYAEQQLLAVPFTAYDYDEYGFWLPKNSIELFHVSVENGISKLGSLDANALLTPAERGESDLFCEPYGYGPPVERGLFIEDTLYAAGDRGIIAADVANPSVPLAVVEFQPEPSVYCYNTGGTGGAWDGAGGMTGGAFTCGSAGEWTGSAGAASGDVDVPAPADVGDGAGGTSGG